MTSVGLLVFCLPPAPFGAWGAAAGPFISRQGLSPPPAPKAAKLGDAGVWPWAGSRPSDKTEALRSLGAPACIAHGHAVARHRQRGFRRAFGSNHHQGEVIRAGRPGHWRYRRGVQGESFPLVVRERERGAKPPLAGFVGIGCEGPAPRTRALEKGRLDSSDGNRGATYREHGYIDACSGGLKGICGQNFPR